MMILRLPPGMADRRNERGLEYFLSSIYAVLSPVGTATVNLPSIPAGGMVTFTIPVLGAKVGQQHSVSLAPPETIPSGLLWCGYVSAADTVTVRVYNATAAAIDPPPATWGASVRP